ncbi:glycoside hydrolase family 26 protein [Pseudarthrobacter sp. NS4]|uniref:glycoside hydrolase family 26 protein n=1 Tax=Pseudarthrobacter sp. NS4 TaxID=2973976 RepID=UPI002163E67B|nr:glycosyl hydrolase [Pseudarthrobacter sp. NS4]
MRLFRYVLCLVVLLAWVLPLSAAPAHAANPAITLSPDTGPVGTSVKVTGTGFPKKTSGTVSAGTASAPFKTSASGYFTAEVVMPETADPTITVRAATATASASASFTVTYSPSATEEETDPVVTDGSTSTTTPSTAALRFGVGTPGGPMAGSELDEVTALAGEAPSIILSYKDFNQAPPLKELDAVRARSALTLLTWEPWAWGGGTSQPAYALDRITAGDFDPYLRQWGQSLASWGHPVLLRFGHEMNGNWYPWSEQVNGNSSGDYVAAWRHVHDVLTAEGASNITWVWNPNVPYWGSTPLTGLYPGSTYVDAVALDGYNWGTAASWSTWVTPSQLFGDGLSQLRTLAPGKQILIAETSSAEQGGSKAEWNTALISYLASQGDVTAVTWFHFNKETDWRINSSTTSAEALKQALAARK